MSRKYGGINFLVCMSSLLISYPHVLGMISKYKIDFLSYDGTIRKSEKVFLMNSASQQVNLYHTRSCPSGQHVQFARVVPMTVFGSGVMYVLERMNRFTLFLNDWTSSPFWMTDMVRFVFEWLKWFTLFLSDWTSSLCFWMTELVHSVFEWLNWFTLFLNE